MGTNGMAISRMDSLKARLIRAQAKGRKENEASIREAIAFLLDKVYSPRTWGETDAH